LAYAPLAHKSMRAIVFVSEILIQPLGEFEKSSFPDGSDALSAFYIT
jgi:hypothetical protein